MDTGDNSSMKSFPSAALNKHFRKLKINQKEKGTRERERWSLSHRLTAPCRVLRT